jgi:hypothetical protein
MIKKNELPLAYINLGYFEVVVFELLPGLGYRELLQEVADGYLLLPSVVVAVHFAALELDPLADTRQLHKVQYAVPCRHKVVRIFVVVQKHGRQVHGLRRSKGQIVPLRVPVEFVEAGDFPHQVTEASVDKVGLHETAIAVVPGAPTSKAKSVLGEAFDVLFVATVSLFVVFEVKPSDNVVQRMPEEMNCFGDKRLVVSSVNQS